MTHSIKLSKEAYNEWFSIFSMEHATAIISDAFWFVICAVINPDKYPDHVEWFQERMATNYISFTLNDVFLESNPGKMSNQELSKKERFFRNFYDAIAQSVFYALFYAYPKSRLLLNDAFKRELLDLFSEMFTGMQIKSAKFDHWSIDGAPTGEWAPAKKESKGGQEITLADVDQRKRKNAKTRREML